MEEMTNVGNVVSVDAAVDNAAPSNFSMDASIPMYDGTAGHMLLGMGIGVGIVALGVGGYFLVKKIIKSSKEKKAAEAKA